jgi:hypothetical protein
MDSPKHWPRSIYPPMPPPTLKGTPMQRTLTAKTTAWFSNPADIVNCLDPAKRVRPILTDSDMSDCGWIKIQDLEVLITLPDTDKLLLATIEVMEEAKRKLQADTQAKLTVIDGEIQKLLSLTWENPNARR